MTERECIDILRYALASVWTDLEYHIPEDMEVPDSWDIANQALRLTDDFAPRGKDLTDDGTGYNGWKDYLKKKGIEIDSTV